jgi:hypothetical protein
VDDRSRDLPVRWHLSWRADPQGRVIADNHYNRQHVGAPQFVPPGRCVVLTIPGHALWVTSWPFKEFVKHAWGGAWVNSCFRNERRDLYLSSELIVEAIAATRWTWPQIPDLGMVTFIDADEVKHKRDPGRCYAKAGFVNGEPRTTEGGLIVKQMWPHQMPAPEAPIGANLSLFDLPAVVSP